MRKKIHTNKNHSQIKTNRIEKIEISIQSESLKFLTTVNWLLRCRVERLIFHLLTAFDNTFERNYRKTKQFFQVTQQIHTMELYWR